MNKSRSRNKERVYKMNTRVAFASTDGQTVNEHFGHAKYWEIYDIGEDIEYVDSRMVQASCSCHDPKVFEAMLDALSDCEVLLVAKIGGGAAQFLISKGKRVFEAAGDLYSIADSLVERKLLEAV